jgi:hypothetical protein
MWFVNGRSLNNDFSGVKYGCGWEDRALQECNLSARSPVDCESIRPGACDWGTGIFVFRNTSQATGQSEKLNWFFIPLGTFSWLA